MCLCLPVALAAHIHTARHTHSEYHTHKLTATTTLSGESVCSALALLLADATDNYDADFISLM